MKQIIKLNSKYIDKILNIQKNRFSDHIHGDLISKNYLLEYLSLGNIYGYISKKENLKGFVFIKSQSKNLRIYDIASSANGEGIGSKLISFIIELIKKNIYESVYLEVDVKNFKAINFYFKHKFKIIDIMDNFYENHDRAYRMELIC